MVPNAGGWRAARAVLVAAACVGVSLCAHAAAGGHAPGAAAPAGLWVAATPVTYLLSRRRWTFGRLLVVLGVAQLVVHPALALAAPGGEAHAGVAMLLGHALAAVLLAALLAYGDALQWRTAELVATVLRPLAASVRRVLSAATAVPPLPVHPRPYRPDPPERPRPPGLTVAPHPRRGPPRYALSR